ncbi:MAG: hypothetical protein ACREUW_07550 [Burkholderiales bacterium]
MKLSKGCGRALVHVALWGLGATVCVAAEGTGKAASIPTARSAVESGLIGLFPATDFRLVQGACADCAAPRQALWYFQDDFVAVPRKGVDSVGYDLGVLPKAAVQRWHAAATPRELQARPAMVWIGSPEVVEGARLLPTGGRLRLADGSTAGFGVVPKLPTNRSYYNEATQQFFQQRPLRIRGRVEAAPAGAMLVARTVWPEDYVIDAQRAKLVPLANGEQIDQLVRQAGDYETRLLWERNPGQPRDWSKLSALGLMLNGAQGDDDEAHGGHFGIVTGRLGPRGEWAEWLVNNFYNLDSHSEKGIVAAMVPMDNYLMDLNSGQSYYRPSYMLVALLRDDRAAYAYQAAIARVFNHFYRHDFRYRHAGANCAGISMDTLRALGWQVPVRGPTSYAKAAVAYPYMAIKEGSLDSGRQAFDYLREERTRLYPAVAFDAAGMDLLRLATGSVDGRALSAYERMLAEDLEAIVFVRIPQIPSSRAAGQFPVASIDEYMKRAPEDKSKWQIVPVEPRPFPQEFISADTEAERLGHAGLGLAGVLLLGGVMGIACGWRAMRRRSARLRH